jgi:Sulfotransferase family
MGLGDLYRRVSPNRRLLEERLDAMHRQLRAMKQEQAFTDKAVLNAFARTHELLEAMGDPALDAPTAAELGRVVASRTSEPVRVDQPLVLISQVQRSGGTLLSQLFDGHPQVHAHPQELHLGWPRGKYMWPKLDLADSPDAWFETLSEPATHKMFFEGYSKPGREELDRFPFLLPPTLQRRIFVAAVAARPVQRPRDVLDAYMTSYFNGWLDNQNLYGDDKRWVTAFAARLAMTADNRAAFFADYPDGHLVGIVREPASWFASASRYQPSRYGEVGDAMEAWRGSVEALLDARREHADRVHLVSFEQLVADPEAVMGELTARLDIELAPSALTPTFNGRRIRANSSFAVERHGVLRETAARGDTLEPGVQQAVLEQAGDLYDRALAALA